jgi:AraC-like DNA-binding protein
MLTILLAFLPLAVCSFWSIALLLEYAAKRTEVLCRLLVFMLVATLLYLGHFVYFVRALWLMPFVDTLYVMCNLSVYPLFLFYVMQLTKGRVGPRWRLMLLPALVAGVVSSALYLLMDDAGRSNFVDSYLYKSAPMGTAPLAHAAAVVHNVCKVVFAVLVVVTFWYGDRCLSAYRREVDLAYADTEGRTLQPIRGLFLLFVVTSVVSFFFNILGRRFFIDSEWLLAVPSLLFSSLLFGLGYVGRRRMFSYADLRPVDITEPAEPLGTDVQPRIEEVAREIEKLMDEERFYLNFDLHVEDVARKLGTNSKYVSLALNQIVGVTFSDYVNRRRIAYACELQRQQPELPMTEIARRSGYTAMASFYRNMKRWGGKIGN